MIGDRKNSFDVVIAGGGPAGSSAAIRLSEAGFKVLLVEQKTFPRAKLCGEFVSPECLTYFDELGVMREIENAGGSEIGETIFFSQNGKSVSVKSDWFGSNRAQAVGLSRARLDEILLDRARTSGCEIREGTSAGKLMLDGEKIVGLILKNDRIRARIVIDATGRTRALARQLDNGFEKRSAARQVAFKAHLTRADITPNACEIYSYKGGYGGCTYIEDGIFNLCFIAAASDTKRLGGDAERVMREVVFKNKRAAAVLDDVSIVGSWLAVPVAGFGRVELVPAEGLFTTGDAAAFIDPFTGSGILLALESSKIAADAIITGFKNGSGLAKIASEYRKEYSSAVERRLRVSSVLRRVAYFPRLANAAISLFGISGRFRKIIARSTRG